jgi:hypothetical protein
VARSRTPTSKDTIGNDLGGTRGPAGTLPARSSKPEPSPAARYSLSSPYPNGGVDSSPLMWVCSALV